MFTGIIQSIGTVTGATPFGGDMVFVIHAPALDLAATKIGDSIACNGCCLTVTKLDGPSFQVDVSHESLNVTTLRNWRIGTKVNLETALRAGDALGGHYVSGHVDAIGDVVALREEGLSLRVELQIPRTLGRYIACKGSVCIDGVSLTVNGVSDSDAATRFDVNLIPHTREQTILQHYQIGTRVNVEIDMIARYLERMRSLG